MVYFLFPRLDTGSSIYLKVFVSQRCRARVNERERWVPSSKWSRWQRKQVQSWADAKLSRCISLWPCLPSIFSITLLEWGKYSQTLPHDVANSHLSLLQCILGKPSHSLGLEPSHSAYHIALAMLSLAFRSTRAAGSVPPVGIWLIKTEPDDRQGTRFKWQW